MRGGILTNESVDLGQRSRELVEYYREHIASEKPQVGYWFLREQMREKR